MYNYGIRIIEADYTPQLASVLSAKVEVWNVDDQCPYFYQFWVNPNNDGGSSVKQSKNGEYEFVYRGDYAGCRQQVERVLSVTHSEWDYYGFSRYVAGWCDGKRMMEAKR